MSGEQMVALSKKHTLFEWSAQSKVDPLPVAKAKGVYFWTPEGKRFIDLNSQLMSVNIGHGDPRVIMSNVDTHQLTVEVDETFTLGSPEVDALGFGYRQRVDFRLRGPLKQSVFL